MILKRDPLANPEPLIRSVYAYAAYRVGDGPDAEDITNDTFERALRYRKSFDPARGEPIAWLIGIAKRCIDDAAGRKLGLVPEVPDAASTGDLEREAMHYFELSAALAQLDERDRELIALRYGADLTARQIAELLDAKTNAIEVALHRALERMRAVMAGDEPAKPLKPATKPVRI